MKKKKEATDDEETSATTASESYLQTMMPSVLFLDLRVSGALAGACTKSEKRAVSASTRANDLCARSQNSQISNNGEGVHP